MVTRIWEGKTENEHAEIYSQLVEDRDIPNYQQIEGYIKHSFLRRSDENFTYFKLITYWENLEVIKDFTGPTFDEAVAYQLDKDYLVDYPGQVVHFEVFAE
ncbi:MAG: antibiotic biosynthesis monooxygenase [Flavobacteriales bacterium]|nr:antibiotic biosynthesis monooxygenase [Flavobacteriales bacterium]